MSDLPVVSVRTITYNHEKYIGRCLEGILMQRTTFPFEVIIGEDCSTDRTREIVLAYQNRYPDKIRALTSDTNVGAAQNTLRVMNACRGKYQAFCEGDDYWIDPLKLQKQVDFLEAHSEVTLCFHNLFVVNERDLAARLYFSSAPQEIVPFEDVFRFNVQLASVVARAGVLASLPEWRFKVWCNDLLIRLWCAHHGPLGYLDEIMAVYRRQPGGMIMTMEQHRKKRYAEEIYMYREFDRETGYQHTDLIRAKIRQTESQSRREHNRVLYYILGPSRFVAKAREYYTLVDKQYRMYR